jgi:tetratricopeptide (TPR) repeat protein
VATVLRPFRPSATLSRVLITSRFPFSLPAGKEDLAARFERIELASFNDTAERKLTLRHRAAAHTQHLADLEQREALLPRARTAARGNPGLLELLSGCLVLNPAVPLAQAEAALDQMEAYLAQGALPATEALREQLQAIAVSTLLNLAGSAGQALLRAMTMFDLPVPRRIGEVLAANLGGRLQALIDLALIEPGQDPVLAPQPAIRASPLAASQLAPLTDEERSALAGVVVKPLFETWGGKGAGRAGHAELQLAQMALAAGDSEVAAACGATAIRTLEGASYQAAADLASALLALLAEAGQALPPRLIAFAARVIGATGKGDLADDLLAQAVGAMEAGSEGLDPMDAAHLFAEQGNRQLQTGNLDAAASCFGAAAEYAKAANDPISVAVARGRIADILEARGQLDEALRILQKEQLPVYERLGDVRSKAVTMGKIADILEARGQLDEALRIRRQEQLPVYERLGDVCSKAVTMGYIADILQARGQLDEALRIRQEEELPVYERLGDVRSKAVTMGRIADILQARGQLDEALRIRQEEELPVYERLGDVRSKAVTMGRIADILRARGQLDEALRIRRQEQLPVHERSGDVLSKAVTMGKIADILRARGQLDEALRIRQEEELPVYERLGDVRSLLVGRANTALILMKRKNDGDREAANRLLCLALADACHLRIPEADQIRQLLQDFGMACGDSRLGE